jgi:NAD(P)-dependent dehydrogenase (short-subunit alcohol dehydrogenase family)
MADNKVGRVAGKVAFITGAARGQGREHAIRLAEEGADIVAVDVCEDIDVAGYPGPSEADLADTAALVEKAGRPMCGISRPCVQRSSAASPNSVH